MHRQTLWEMSIAIERSCYHNLNSNHAFFLVDSLSDILGHLGEKETGERNFEDL